MEHATRSICAYDCLLCDLACSVLFLSARRMVHEIDFGFGGRSSGLAFAVDQCR